MRRRAAISACLLSLCLTACGGGTRSAATSSGSAMLTPAQLARRAGQRFLDSYLNQNGQIIRRDQGADVVSEGQAYGMLIAAALGEEGRFASIWSWTQRNLQRPDGLLDFHWAGGHVVDGQPASDADLDAARALLLAAARFGRPEYRTEAIRLGRAILAHETAPAGRYQVLLAGPWANKGSTLVFNPSYVDPASLEALGAATGDARFRALAVSGIALVNVLTRPLPPDWALVDAPAGQVTPVSSADATTGPGMFTFDAPRTLVRMAAGGYPGAAAAVARAWDVFKATRPQDIVVEHQLSGTAVGTDHSPLTLVATAAAAQAAGAATMVAPLLAQAEALDEQRPTYFGGAWVALGRLMLTTGLLKVTGS